MSGISGTCYWCLMKKPVSFQDGFYFCSGKCEDNYYNDRTERRKHNRPPLFIDRQSVVTAHKREALYNEC